MNRNEFRKILGISATVIGAGFIISSIIAKKKKPESGVKTLSEKSGKQVVVVA